MQIKLVEDAPRHKRRMRRPRIDTSSIMIPYGIAPIGFHPVLPGETLKSLWGQLTFVSDPLRSRFQTGWLDTFAFYVKHSQLNIASDLINMHVDGVTLPTTPLAAEDREFITPAGGVDFVKRCYDQIVAWYFRDSDEALTPATGLLSFDQQPAQIQRDGWWQSGKLASSAPASDHELPGEDPEQPTDNIVEATYANHWTQWQRMRALGLTEATYEDYLKAQGVAVVEKNNDEELNKPELLGRWGEFLMPVNTVEPSTGTPSTAHVKTLKLQLDAAKALREPGWIMLVACWRPKVHLNNIKGTMAAFMTEADDWMPASLSQHGYTSLKSFNSATGPAPVATTGASAMWVDLRDYLLYGEQQCFYSPNDATDSYTLRTTGMLAPALPDANFNTRYLTTAQAKDVFLNPANFNAMRVDGVISFEIASQIGGDQTP